MSDTVSSTFDLPVRRAAAGAADAAAPISEAEWAVRRDLAAAYRLCALFGWDDLIYTHLSARVPGTEDQFLVNPLGLGFDEINASNLIKIDLDGRMLSDSAHAPNAAGFVIRGGIHMARHDAACVMHLHTEAGMALSCLKDGLLPLTQHAMRFVGRIGYHDYDGIALGTGERERLVADLQGKAALVLRNHGTITVGASVGHAFVETFYLEKAARAQFMALSSGAAIHHPDPEVVALTARQWQADHDRNSGPREWPHLLRRLERIAPDYRL
ncbi:MAG: class II aldolase/adducin family protein [Burkholderiaceae bacterium]